jgi:hypothetical protein
MLDGLDTLTGPTTQNDRKVVPLLKWQIVIHEFIYLTKQTAESL